MERVRGVKKEWEGSERSGRGQKEVGEVRKHWEKSGEVGVRKSGRSQKK